MPAQRILLKKGQNPLEMDFTVHQPNYTLIVIGGLLLLCSGVGCLVVTLFATGVLK